MTGHIADLFDLPPIARKSDPPTSRVAALKYTETARVSDRQVIKALVGAYPGHTVQELARKHTELLIQRGWNPFKAGQKGARTASRRLSELEETGDIRAGASRTCRESGHTARTWYPA